MAAVRPIICALLLLQAAAVLAAVARLPASDDVRLVPLSILPPPGMSSPSMREHAEFAQWLHETVVAPAEEAQRQAAWSEVFRAWIEDWYRLQAHVHDGSDEELQFDQEATLIAAGCDEPVLVYAYAEQLAQRERHVEFFHRLMMVYPRLQTGGYAPYLGYLISQALVSENWLPWSSVTHELVHRWGCEQLIQVLRGPGETAVVERAVVDALQEVDGDWEARQVQVQMLKATTTHLVGQLLQRQAGLGSSWLRHMVAALDDLSLGYQQVAYQDTDHALAAQRLLETKAGTELAAAWAADQRWPEAAALMLLVHTQPEERQLWFARALSADPDYRGAWQCYLEAIVADAGPDQVLQAGQEALGSGRFDIDLPMMYLDALEMVDRSLRHGDPAARQAWWSPQRWAELQLLVKGILGAHSGPPGLERWWRSVLVAGAWRCGMHDQALALLNGMAGTLDREVSVMLDVTEEEVRRGH